MADPRTMHLDGASRPWWNVPGLNFCSHCLGALPPVDPDACSTCGTGTPPGLPPVPLLIVAEEPKLIEEETVEAAGPASAKLSWWQRFANWPNHG